MNMQIDFISEIELLDTDADVSYFTIKFTVSVGALEASSFHITLV